MKPYGMKRVQCWQYPDRADVAKAGMPSRRGRLKPHSKATTRRRQKRARRAAGRAEIAAQLHRGDRTTCAVARHPAGAAARSRWEDPR